MTRFNIHEAALLEASGELGRKARQQLRIHLKNDPATRAECELIQADFDVLSGLPMPVVTPRDMVKIPGDIKQGIRRELRIVHKRDKNGRRRFIFGALVGVSSLAACLLVALSIIAVQQNRAHRRELAISKAENSIRDFMNADADNMTDVALASLKGQISNAAAQMNQWNPTESSGNRAKLLDLLDPTVDDDVLDDLTGT